jgi:peptidoglycan/LPS O-acetylase OafA/YrhL/O-antigen/teichoic acid export membrane protein
MTSVAFGVRAEVRRRLADPLLRSAYSLILNVVVTSVLGLGFWIVAARMFAPSTVGRDGALVSAMILVSTICAMNLGSGILRFLPISKLDPRRVVLGAYAATILVSAVGATGFVIVAPRVSDGFSFLAHDTTLAAVYVLAVTAWGVFALQDSVLTALRRAPWIPLENAVFGVLKIAALPILLVAGSLHAVFIAWVIPVVLLLLPVNYLIFSRAIPGRPDVSDEPSPIERFGRRGLARFLANDYLATIFIQASTTLLPVLVVALLGSSQGAYFYIPFTIISAFDLLFINVASSMTVEASIASDRLSELARSTVRRFGGVLAVGVLLLVLGAGLILLPFGPAYADGGASLLRLLACASVFRAVIGLYSAICRVQGRAGRVLGVQATVFALLIVLTPMLGRSHGLEGVGMAWLVANALVACAVAQMAIGLLRQPGAGHKPASEPPRRDEASRGQESTTTGRESLRAAGARLDSLTGLRALAALIVFVHHGPGLFGGTLGSVWNHLTTQGAIGVTFFFALSGFVLTWSHRTNDTARAFYRRRIARIYPAMFVSLVAGVLINAHVGSPASGAQIAVTFAGLQTWIPDPHYYFAVNGVTWSLSCELFFYLTFPLYAHRLASTTVRQRRVLQAALVGFIAAFSVVALAQDGLLMARLSQHLPFVRMGEFVLGALVAVDVFKGTWPRIRWPVAVSAAAVAYVGAGFIPNLLGNVVVVIVPLLFLIGAAAQADLRGTPTVFARPWLVWLGTISYCFYLVHELVIIELGHDFGSAGNLLVLPVALVVAAALHYFVERPIERRLRGRKRVVVASIESDASRTVHVVTELADLPRYIPTAGSAR